MKLTTVIQGYLHPNALLNIPNYKKYGPVVISTWDTSNLKLLELCDTKGVKVIITPLPEIDKLKVNNGNVYYQIVSSLSGLKLVDTEYALKVRCDEYYVCLDPLVEKLTNATEKLISNNLFFRVDEHYKFHASDHMLATKTEYLCNGFQRAKLYCEVKDEMTTVLSKFPKTPAPEQILTVSILEAMGVELSLETSKEQMKQYVDFVRLREFGAFMCSFKDSKVRTMMDSENFELIHKYGRCVVDTMDEL